MGNYSWLRNAEDPACSGVSAADREMRATSPRVYKPACTSPGYCKWLSISQPFLITDSAVEMLKEESYKIKAQEERRIHM